MVKTKRKFGHSFKARIAIEAIKERYTLAKPSERFESHPTQMASWKRELVEGASLVLSRASTPSSEPKVNIDKLYSKTGQLEMERDFLKKLTSNKPVAM